MADLKTDSFRFMSVLFLQSLSVCAPNFHGLLWRTGGTREALNPAFDGAKHRGGWIAVPVRFLPLVYLKPSATLLHD